MVDSIDNKPRQRYRLNSWCSTKRLMLDEFLDLNMKESNEKGNPVPFKQPGCFTCQRSEHDLKGWGRWLWMMIPPPWRFMGISMEIWLTLAYTGTSYHTNNHTMTFGRIMDSTLMTFNHGVAHHVSEKNHQTTPF